VSPRSAKSQALMPMKALMHTNRYQSQERDELRITCPTSILKQLSNPLQRALVKLRTAKRKPRDSKGPVLSAMSRKSKNGCGGEMGSCRVVEPEPSKR